jgi:N-methylhydantoinase A
MSPNSTATSYVVGVDIGGTFSDCIVVGDDGTIHIGKAPSTPPDFEQGFVASMRSAADRIGIGLDELVARTSGIYHGCTVGTNALVERRTAKVALLTTRGAGDVLRLMSSGHRLWGSSPDYIAHVAKQEKSEELVPRDLVVEIDERTDVHGDVIVALDEDGCREKVRALLGDGVEGFAVSFLWSVVNPEHEEAVRRIVEDEAPGAFVTCGASLVSRQGEYERTVATTINALIGPVMSTYLGKLEAELRTLGYDRTLWIMSCTGGVMDADYARKNAVLTVGSGPVAGLIGAGMLQSASPESGDVITADMGGTTFDVGVIRGNHALSRKTSRHEQYEYFVPTLDVRSIGAGGGSLIRFDPELRTLRVGPASAGARPGPACYGRGGTEPTVTDAAMALGLLNPESFQKVGIEVDVDASRAALEKAGSPLGFGAAETAAAALRIVDNQMADAIRLASVQQGYEPAQHSLYAYGGGGPLHATSLAKELGITRVVVPLGDLASGWSAFGIASADVVVSAEAALSLVHPFDLATVNDSWEAVRAQVATAMAEQGIADEELTWEFEADMRYSMQVNQIPVRTGQGPYDEGTIEGLIVSFEQEYERLFGPGSGYGAAGYALDGVRVRARAQGGRSSTPESAGGGAASAPEPISSRAVTFYESATEPSETPIYSGADLVPGASLAGPAVVEFDDTTLVLRTGDVATVDALGSVLIDC